jgi:hypothetical protein
VSNHIVAEGLRIAVMGERYGDGNMRTVCRAFRELYDLHQSSARPHRVEEAQPGKSPTAPAAHCRQYIREAMGTLAKADACFDANDEATDLGGVV